MALSSS